MFDDSHFPCRVAHFVFLLGAALPSLAPAQVVFSRLTPPSDEANARSDAVDVSSDGRTVVFSSSATNWIPESNGTNKVIAFDLGTGQIEVVSRASDGAIINGRSATVSRDGRHVAFLNNGSLGWQAMRKDRGDGELRLASANAAGDAANSAVGDNTVSISGDGRFIAFEASSSNLGVVTGGFAQIFVKDMDSGALELASVAITGGATGSSCRLFPHALSDNGRLVAFICNATLAPGAGTSQAYVRDLQNDTTELISRASGSAGPTATTPANRLAMSASGRFVTFQAPFVALGGDPATHSGVYLRDRLNQTTASIPTPDGATPGNCSTTDVSDSGTVVLSCIGLGTSRGQVFLHVPAAASILVSEAAGTPGNGSSGGSVAIAASGLSLAFESTASNLVADDTNEVPDVFVLVDSAVLTRLFANGFEE